MVDIKESIDQDNKLSATITTDKMNTEVIVYQPLGPYSFYSIRYLKGQTPKELSGQYTSFKGAVEAVTKYLRNKKDTPARKRDRRYEDASELHSSSK